MFTQINEPVEVQGTFSTRGFVPRRFRWRNQIRVVEEVTLAIDEKNGVTKHRFYSVRSGTSVYRLDFNRESDLWRLLEVYCE